MTNKELLQNKINFNKDKLKNLQRKKENLEKEISNLERKIRNQENNLLNIKKEFEVQPSDEGKGEENKENN